MARPETNGCLYFPLDCNFFEDRKFKLLRARCGAKAEGVVIRLWCMIYAENGWYVRFGEDDAALLTESLGEGYSIGYIGDVVQESCKRGLFNKDIFTQFHVLTSAGIQKQYLSIRSHKKTIPVIREYWLLKPDFFEGDKEQLLLKLRFFNVKGEETAVSTEETAVNTETTQQKKRKEKQNKEKQNSGGWAGDFAGGDKALEQALLDFRQARAENKKPMTENACVRLTGRLSQLADAAHVKDRSRYMREVLDKSIRSGWTDVYKLDEFQDTALHVMPGGVNGADCPRVITSDTNLEELL